VSQVETIVAELKTLSREERQTEQVFLRLGAVLAEMAYSSEAHRLATKPETLEDAADNLPKAQLPKPGEETKSTPPQKRTTRHSGHPSRRRTE